jgi:NADH-quinone oxidoreductase subunit E
MVTKYISSVEDDIVGVESLLERYTPNPEFLIAILQDLQAEFHYLPKQMFLLVAEKLGLPLSQVYRVATFYNAFSLEPKGKHLISICTGTACHVRGTPRIVERLQDILKIEAGQTTPDRKFTLQTVNCLGACALGPLVVIDGKYHGRMTSAKIEKALKNHEQETQ